VTTPSAGGVGRRDGGRRDALLTGVQALACRAVLRFHDASIFAILHDGCNTAVTAIPLTTTIVVAVVASAIALPISILTTPSAVARSDALLTGVQALACIAVLRFHDASIFAILHDGSNTAVTAIPLATTIVVVIVASAIALPIRILTIPWTGDGGRRDALLTGVQALACIAVVRFHEAS